MSDETKTGESYWDKTGIPLVTLTDALWQIEMSLKVNQTRGVWCLISEAGEGKSQSVNALLERMGHRVVDIRTAQLTHVGAGVPQRAVDGFFDYAVPADWPKPGEKAAMLFDEVNQGQPFAIALVFKMLEDRGIYGYKLPDECPVILLMNPGTSAYNTSRIETNPAINRRVKKLYIHNDFPSWRTYAESKNFHKGKDFPDGQDRSCHPLVISFLATSPALLYAGKERDMGKQFACPATWQTVSHDLYTLETVGEPLTSGRALQRIGATINMVQAEGFVAYVKNNEILISPLEVLQNYKKNKNLRERILKLQKEPGGHFTDLSAKVAHELFHTQPDVHDTAPHVLKFWADMPIENRAPYYSVLQAAAITNDRERSDKNITYMKKLTMVFNEDPLWETISQTTISTEEAGKVELEAGQNAKKTLQANAAR